MEETLYTRLREYIDRFSVGMNKTESGVEIEILRRIFTPDEAELYLSMTDCLEPATAIAERSGRPLAETERILAKMGKKGLLFFKTLGDEKRYAVAPYMHGLYEHQAYRKDRELSTLFDTYLTSGFIPKDRSLRTVPIHREVNAEAPVLPFDDIKKIIMEKKKIGLFHCPCALHSRAMGGQIESPTEVCMAFDFYAEFYVEEMKIGRWITADEALDILLKTEEAGLVHQVGGNRENTECICNCNSTFCGILKFIKLFPSRPALLRPTTSLLSTRTNARAAAPAMTAAPWKP